MPRWHPYSLTLRCRQISYHSIRREFMKLPFMLDNRKIWKECVHNALKCAIMSSFDVIVFNRCPRSPWVRLLLSSPSEKAHELRTEQYFQLLQAGHWLVWLPFWFEMVICIQRRPTVKWDQCKCTTLPLGQLGKSVFPRLSVTGQKWLLT